MTRHRFCWVFLELLILCLVVTVAQDSTGPTDPYILLANGNFIQHLSLTGSNRRAVVSKSTSRIVGLDYDYRRNYLFWSDRDLNTIVRANLNGSNQRVLMNTTLRFPDGVAWDWINQKLYWIEWNQLESKIAVLDPLLGHQKVLFSSNNSMSRLRSIVVDPSNGWLYWSDWAGDTDFVGKIERSSMDGQNRQTLHESLGWPAPMTIDYGSQMLYWADTRSDRIERSHVDGSGRETLLESNTYQPFSMSIFQEQLYLSNVLGGLGSFTSGASAVTSHIDFGVGEFTYGVQVVSQSRQLEAPNPCAQNNGGCSYLCLLSAVTQQRFSCICPDELVLAADMRTCVDPDFIVPLPTTTTTTIPDGPVSTDVSDANPTLVVMTEQQPTSTPEGLCRAFLCQNGATCHNVGQNEYFCMCAPGYEGTNCGVKAPSGFTISAPIFVGVVAGLVIVIFLMFVTTLCVLGLRKRRKTSLDGSDTNTVTTLSHQTINTTVNDHDYDSIHSNQGAKTHYYISLPGQSASNESSPRESSIQDTAVKVDPDFSNSTLQSKLQTL